MISLPDHSTHSGSAGMAGHVSDDTARKAAEAVTAYGSHFTSLDLRIERMHGRLTLIQWMLALLIGGVASLVVKAFA